MNSFEELQQRHLDADSDDYTRLELSIVHHYLNAAIAAGYELMSVWDGEDRHSVAAHDVLSAMDHIFAVDTANLLLKKDGKKINQCFVLGEGEAMTIADEAAERDSHSEELAQLWEDAVKALAPDLYETYFI